MENTLPANSIVFGFCTMSTLSILIMPFREKRKLEMAKGKEGRSYPYLESADEIFKLRVL